MFPFNETVIAQIFYADSALQQNGFVRIIDVRITAYLLLNCIHFIFFVQPYTTLHLPTQLNFSSVRR